MSFKGTNDKMINSEKGNGENLLGFNLSYGTTTCVMDTGKEYFDISPVWQYDSLPGTTALTEDDETLDKWYDNTEFRRLLEEGIYSGGVTNDATFSMQSTKHEGTTYTVTCFATNDGMVILGCNLVNKDDKDLHTTIEQCIVHDGQTPSISDDCQVVTHGNVVYSNLDLEEKFEIDNTKLSGVSGKWYRNNHAYDPQDTATAKVLHVKLDRKNKNSYAYCIQPKTKITKKFIVICNNPEVQAIKLPNGKIAAAFYKDATFEYDGRTYSGSAKEYKIF